MNGMFRRLNSLTSLDVSHFDIAQVNDMSYIFAYNDKLASLDVEGWDIRNVKARSSAFASTNSRLKVHCLPVGSKFFNKTCSAK